MSKKSCSYVHKGKSYNLAEVVRKLAKARAGAMVMEEGVLNAPARLGKEELNQILEAEHSANASSGVVKHELRTDFVNNILAYVLERQLFAKAKSVKMAEVAAMFRARLEKTVDEITNLIADKQRELERITINENSGIPNQPGARSRVELSLQHNTTRLQDVKAMLENYSDLFTDVEFSLKSRANMRINKSVESDKELIQDADDIAPDGDTSGTPESRANKQHSYDDMNIYFPDGASGISERSKMFMSIIPVINENSFRSILANQGALSSAKVQMNAFNEQRFFDYATIYNKIRSRMADIRGDWDTVIRELYAAGVESGDREILSFVRVFGDASGGSFAAEVMFIENKRQSYSNDRTAYWQSTGMTEADAKKRADVEAERYAANIRSEMNRFKAEFMFFMMSTMRTNMTAALLSTMEEHLDQGPEAASSTYKSKHSIIESNATDKTRSTLNEWQENHARSALFKAGTGYVDTEVLNSVMTLSKVFIGASKEKAAGQTTLEVNDENNILDHYRRLNIKAPEVVERDGKKYAVINLSDLQLGILTFMGIRLSPKVQKALSFGGDGVSYRWGKRTRKYRFESAFANNGIIQPMLNTLEAIYGKGDPSVEPLTMQYDPDRSVFRGITQRDGKSVGIQAILYNLAREQARTTPQDAPTSFKTSGKTISEYITSQPVYDRYMEFKQGRVHRFFRARYSARSMWLSSAYEAGQGGEYTMREDSDMEEFDIAAPDIDPLKDSTQQRRTSKDLSKLSRPELEMYKITLFTNGKNYKQPTESERRSGGVFKGMFVRRTTHFYPPLGDKDRGVLLKNVPGIITMFESDAQNPFKIERGMDGKSPILELLFDQLFTPEANRIRAAQGNPQSRIKGTDNGSKMFFFVPEFNYLENIWVNGDDGLRLKTESEMTLKDKEIILDVLERHIVKLGHAKYKKWRANGIGDTYTEFGVKTRFKDLPSDWVSTFAVYLEGSGVPSSRGRALNSFVTKLPEKTTVSVATELGFYNGSKEIGSDRSSNVVDEVALMRAAIDMEVNSLLTTANAHMMMAGDIAAFFDGTSEIVVNGESVLINSADPNFRDTLEDAIKDQDQATKEALRKKVYSDLILKTSFNRGKRMSADGGPGNVIPSAFDPDNFALYNQSLFSDDSEWGGNTFNMLILADVKLDSDSFGEMFNLDGAASGFREAYKGIKVTDGATLVNWRHTLSNLFAKGELSLDQAHSLHRKLVNQERDLANRGKISEENLLSDEELYGVFRAIKPMYLGDEFREEIGENQRIHSKTADITLIPQLTAGMEIDKLRVFATRRKFHRVAFDSAVKIGNFRNSLKLFDKDGNFSLPTDENGNPLSNEALEKAVEASAWRKLSLEGFRIQQEVPYYDDEAEVSRVTQASKLLFVNLLHTTGFRLNPNNFDGDLALQVAAAMQNPNGMSGKQLSELYVRIVEEIVVAERDKLFKKLHTDDGDINVEYYRQLILEEAIRRDYPYQLIDSIRKIDDLKELAMLPNGERLESLLMSMITKKVINFLMPGSSYVMATDLGFKPTQKLDSESKEAKKILENPGIVYTSSYTGTLKAGIKGEPFQVFVTNSLRDSDGNIINLLEKRKGKYVWLDEIDGKLILRKGTIQEDLLKMYGMRIPNQGHNSQANIEIVGFLPPHLGDMIIGPRDIITRMGSDFDIDKLYTYAYAHSLVHGNPDAVSDFISNAKKILGSLPETQETKALDELLKEREEWQSVKDGGERPESFTTFVSKLLEEDVKNLEKSVAKALRIKRADVTLSLSDIVAVVNSLTLEGEHRLNHMGFADYSHPEFGNILSNYITDEERVVHAAAKKLLKQYNSQPVDEVQRLENLIIQYIDSSQISQVKDLLDQSKQAMGPRVVRYNGKNRSKRLKNSIIDIHHSVAENSSQEVYEEYSAPLTAWEFHDDDTGGDSERIYEMRRARGLTSSVDSIISSEFASEDYLDSTAGKALIGNSSLSQTLNATLQQAGAITDDEGNEYGIKLKIRRQASDEIYYEDVGSQYTDLEMTLGELRFGEDDRLDSATSLDGNRTLKSVIFSALQTLFVDNAKLRAADKLNLNFKTYSAVAGMVQMGFGTKVSRLVSQDIIYDLVKEMNRLEYETKNSFVSNQAYENVRARYEAELKELTSDATVKAEGIGIDYDAKEGSSELTNGRLEEMIRDGAPGDIDSRLKYLEAQIHILDKFMFFDGIGRELSSLSSALSTDTTAGGTSLIEARERIETIRSKTGENKEYSEYPKSSNFTVAGQNIAVTNTALTFGYRLNEDESDGRSLQPTTVQGVMYEHGLKFIDSITDPIFQLSSPFYEDPNFGVFREAERVIGRVGRSVKSRVEFFRRIHLGVKSFLQASQNTNLFSGSVFLERRRLLLGGFSDVSDTLISQANVLENELMATDPDIKIIYSDDVRLDLSAPMFGASWNSIDKTLTLPLKFEGMKGVSGIVNVVRALISFNSPGMEPAKRQSINRVVAQQVYAAIEELRHGDRAGAVNLYLSTVLKGNPIADLLSGNETLEKVLNKAAELPANSTALSVMLLNTLNMISYRLYSSATVTDNVKNSFDFTLNPTLVEAVILPLITKIATLTYATYSTQIAGKANLGPIAASATHFSDENYLSVLLDQLLVAPSRAAGSSVTGTIGKKTIVTYDEKIARKPTGVLVSELHKRVFEGSAPKFVKENLAFKKIKSRQKGSTTNARRAVPMYELVLQSSGRTSSISDDETARSIAHFIMSKDSEQVFDTVQGKVVTYRDLMLDVIVWNYITGGGQFALRFAKYMPVSVLRAMGFNEFAKALDLQDSGVISELGSDPSKVLTQYNYHKVSRALKQIIQHTASQNSARLSRSHFIEILEANEYNTHANSNAYSRRSIGEIRTAGTAKFVQNANYDNLQSFKPTKSTPTIYIRTADGESHLVYAPFVSLYDRASKITHLFQFNGEAYIRIPTLNLETMAQYNAHGEAYPQVAPAPITSDFSYSDNVIFPEEETLNAPTTVNGNMNGPAGVQKVIDTLQGVTSVETLIAKLLDENFGDSVSQTMLRFLLNNIDAVKNGLGITSDIGININTSASKTDFKYAYNYANNTHSINIDIAWGATSIPQIYQVIAHEMVHAMTVAFLKNPSSKEFFGRSDIKDRVDTIRDYASLVLNLINSNVFRDSKDPLLAMLTSDNYKKYLFQVGENEKNGTAIDVELEEIFYPFKVLDKGAGTNPIGDTAMAEFMAEVMTEPIFMRLLNQIDMNSPEVQGVIAGIRKKYPTRYDRILKTRSMTQMFKDLIMDMLKFMFQVIDIAPNETSIFMKAYSVTFDLMHMGVQYNIAKGGLYGMPAMDAKTAALAVKSNFKDIHKQQPPNCSI